MTTIVVIVISYKYSFVILHRHCPLYIHVQQQPVARDVFIKPPLSAPRIAFDWYLVLVAERGPAHVYSDGPQLRRQQGGIFSAGRQNCFNPFLLQFFSSLFIDSAILFSFSCLKWINKWKVLLFYWIHSSHNSSYSLFNRKWEYPPLAGRGEERGFSGVEGLYLIAALWRRIARPLPRLICKYTAQNFKLIRMRREGEIMCRVSHHQLTLPRPLLGFTAPTISGTRIFQSNKAEKMNQ